MSPKTQIALNAIKEACAAGQQRIAPALFSHCYGRAATSAAFRMAKQQGLIELAYTSMVQTPVYRAAGVGQALAEAGGAIQH